MNAALAVYLKNVICSLFSSSVFLFSLQPVITTEMLHE